MRILRGFRAFVMSRSGRKHAYNTRRDASNLLSQVLPADVAAGRRRSALRSARHGAGTAPARRRLPLPRRRFRPRRARSSRDDTPRSTRSPRNSTSRDPNVVALRARAAIERGMYADAETALQAAASRAPASEAALELGLLQQMLSRPDGAGDALARGRAGRLVARRGRARARGTGAAGPRTVPGSQRGIPGRGRPRARERGHPDGVGRPVPGEIQQGRSGQVLPGGARNRSALRAGAPRRRARARRRKPAAGRDARQARDGNQSELGRRTRLPRQSGDRRREARRGARAADQGAGHQPVEPRRSRHAGGAGVRRGQATGVRSRGRQGAGHLAESRRRVPRGRRTRRA